MKATILWAIIFLNLFCLYSCVDRTKENESCKTISVFSENHEKLQFDSIYVVPLQTCKNNLLGDKIKVIQQHCGDIYIGEFGTYNQVFRFSKKGEFKNEIGNIGKGPKEYIGFSDFIVSGDTIEILTGNGIQSRIVRYLKSGKFVSKTKVDLSAISFDKIGSNYLFSTSYQKSRHSCRLYATNLEGVKIVSFLPDTSILNLPVTEWKFSRSDTSILFKEAFDNSVYQYSRGELRVQYQFDFGKYSIPVDFFTKPLFEGITTLNKQGFGNIKNYYETPVFSVFEIILQKDQDLPIISHVVYDKKNDRVLVKSFLENERSCLCYLMGVSNENELVYIDYPHNIIEKMDSYMNLPIKNIEALKNIKITDNPVLLYCKLKENR